MDHYKLFINGEFKDARDGKTSHFNGSRREKGRARTGRPRPCNGAYMGILHNIPHGAACGIVLPKVMRFNADFAIDKLAMVAQALGINTHGMFISCDG